MVLMDTNIISKFKIYQQSQCFHFSDEVFQIDEITIYEDKFSDNKYSLAGDTVDPVSSNISNIHSYIF